MEEVKQIGFIINDRQYEIRFWQYSTEKQENQFHTRRIIKTAEKGAKEIAFRSVEG